jgi:hypothetical protein
LTGSEEERLNDPPDASDDQDSDTGSESDDSDEKVEMSLEIVTMRAREMPMPKTVRARMILKMMRAMTILKRC